jgi:hypothetical protein
MMFVPSFDLLRTVRAGFIQQGTSLAKWCTEQGISRQWATASLAGIRKGPAARTLAARLVKAAGLHRKAEAA